MWTWAIQSITKNKDGLTCTLVYTVTNGIDTKMFSENSVSATPPDDIKSACIRICDNSAAYLNKIDAQKDETIKANLAILIGTQNVVKAAVEAAIPPPSVLTQDQLDRQDFAQVLNDYRIAIAGEALGLVITPDSVTVLATIQKNFKPEYKGMLSSLRF